jgi:NAD(P)-dependent dehydrogenase (short-subunit alcohol dehydrogenase family)
VCLTAAGATPEEALRSGAVRGGTEMARVFITGLSDGLGLMAARLPIEQGHEVALHRRNEGRSRDAFAAAAGARGVVCGDLVTIADARTVAGEVNSSAASTP